PETGRHEAVPREPQVHHRGRLRLLGGPDRPVGGRAPQVTRRLVSIVAVAALTAGCGGGSKTASSTTTVDRNTVILKDVKFQPSTISIRAGETVTWKWEDGSTAHNVHGDGFQNDLITKGTYQHLFTAPGTYKYKCDVHPAMTG